MRSGEQEDVEEAFSEQSFLPLGDGLGVDFAGDDFQ